MELNDQLRQATKKYARIFAPTQKPPDLERVSAFQKSEILLSAGLTEYNMPIGKESYHKIMAVREQEKEQGYKHGWLLHSLNRLELLEFFLYYEVTAQAIKYIFTNLWN